MAEIEIGIGKSARVAHGFEDISIVPSRRTRDPRDVDIRWEIDAYSFDLPILGVPDGLSVLDLEGLSTRYEDVDAATAKFSAEELYEEPIKEELIVERIREIRDSGAVACAALTPQKVEEYSKCIAKSELDIFMIRGKVVSAEHKSKMNEPLNLKQFIREFDIPTIVGGCASYHAALHLMRTGAAGVLVGVNQPALGVGVPQATAIADAKGARMRHLDETGVYVHVIADGQVRNSADVAKAIVCGADAVMLSQPVDDIAEVLKKSIATCGYESIKDFQKAELAIVGKNG